MRNHVRAINDHVPQFRFVGLADVDRTHAERLAAEHIPNAPRRAAPGGCGALAAQVRFCPCPRTHRCREPAPCLTPAGPRGR